MYEIEGPADFRARSGTGLLRACAGAINKGEESVGRGGAAYAATEEDSPKAAWITLTAIINYVILFSQQAVD